MLNYDRRFSAFIAARGPCPRSNGGVGDEKRVVHLLWVQWHQTAARNSSQRGQH